MNPRYAIKTYFPYIIIIILLYLYSNSVSKCYIENQEEVSEDVAVDSPATPRFEIAKLKWAEEILKNVSSQKLKTSIDLSLLYNALPHLESIDKSLLEPVYLLPNTTRHRRMIISIPAIQRPTESYLLATLQSLIKWTIPEDRENIAIMLFLSDEEGKQSAFVKETTALVKQNFEKEVETGLIQMMLIPILYYPPDLQDILPTFNDSKIRMYWRTKQNLDFMYSMTYASQFGDYYLQLEDDIIAAKGYMQNIFYFIEIQKSYPWIMMEFSSLGCIGKLFRGNDLQMIVTIISLFYKKKPVDWIIDEFIRNMYCSPEWSPKKCYNETAKFRLMYEPVQFQHIGKHSSLKGKVQKLKEKTWGKNNKRRNRNNPAATVSTEMNAKSDFTLSMAYLKSGIFHAAKPKEGQNIEISFNKPEHIKAILFTTGTADNPEYQFSEETSVLAIALGSSRKLGNFDKNGRFFAKLNGDPLDGLKISVGSTLDHDVIMDQLAISV